MDKSVVISERNGEMMREFSDRFFDRTVLFHVAGPFAPLIKAFMEENVLKEVEKDSIAITRACSLFEEGREWDKDEVDAIFAMTREVDRKFLEKLSSMHVPVEIEVDYENIEGPRKARISHVLESVGRMLAAWKDRMSFDEAVRASFTEDEYRGFLSKTLDLYIRETEKIGVKPMPLAFGFSALMGPMREVASGVAAVFAKKVFGG